jgi:hypothetical protein
MRVLVVSEETAERLKEREPSAIEVPVRVAMEELIVKLMLPR